jgi:DNA-binding NarL/FixJ family response regulator
MNVLLVDGHPMVHQVLGEVAKRLMPQAKLHLARGLEEAYERARSSGPMDLVVLELGLPGCSGIDALLRFRAAHPSAKIVIFSAAEDRASVLAALTAGAAGYIPKSSSCDVVSSAIRLVVDGGTYIPPQAVIEPKTPAARVSALRGREAEVLRLIVRGLKNREIAARLELTEGTVKQLLHELYKKLGVSSRIQAIYAAARFGITADELPSSSATNES